MDCRCEVVVEDGRKSIEIGVQNCVYDGRHVLVCLRELGDLRIVCLETLPLRQRSFGQKSYVDVWRTAIWQNQSLMLFLYVNFFCQELPLHGTNQVRIASTFNEGESQQEKMQGNHDLCQLTTNFLCLKV